MEHRCRIQKQQLKLFHYWRGRTAYALSGCDTVPQMYGTEKKMTQQFLKSQAHVYNIEDLGKTDANIPWEI